MRAFHVFVGLIFLASTVAYAQPPTTTVPDTAMSPIDVKAALSGKSFAYGSTWRGARVKMQIVFGDDGSLKVSGNGAVSNPGTWIVRDDGKVCRKYEWSISNAISRCDVLVRDGDGQLVLGDTKLSRE